MRKILLIDDEKDFAYFIKQNLEMSGSYKVIVATNGKDGVASAMREKPDLIFLDIMMPGMDGFEVLQRLKSVEATMYIPVVMLTSLGNEEAKERAMELYNEDYIVKPVQMSALEAKIEEVLLRTRA